MQNDSGGSAISNIFAKAQASTKTITEQQNSSPSPTTILKSVNNSGNYMCSQLSDSIQMPSPTIIYHATSPTVRTQCSQNMMEHRNPLDKICHQQESNNQFEYDDENSSQQMQQFSHNNSFNFSQSQITALDESQQQEDQNTIELRMNNLGNENTG